MKQKYPCIKIIRLLVIMSTLLFFTTGCTEQAVELSGFTGTGIVKWESKEGYKVETVFITKNSAYLLSFPDIVVSVGSLDRLTELGLDQPWEKGQPKVFIAGKQQYEAVGVISNEPGIQISYDREGVEIEQKDAPTLIVRSFRRSNTQGQ